MEEEKVSKLRAIELWDLGLLRPDKSGTVEELMRIHAYLFRDLFSFAGKIRTVNLSKGNFRFAPVLFLEENLKIIERMPQSTWDGIIEKYVEMNVAHPFREGNGRATRIWLDEILKTELGVCVDWSLVEKDAYLSSMERSPVNPLELKTLLHAALTEDTENRTVYLRGIASSYRYENLDCVDIFELDPKKNESNHD